MASSIRTFVGPHVELPNCPWTIPFFQASFVFLWDCKQTVSPFTNSGRSFTSVCSGMPASFCFFLFLSSRTPSASCGCRSLSLVSYDSPDFVLDCPLCLARAGAFQWSRSLSQGYIRYFWALFINFFTVLTALSALQCDSANARFDVTWLNSHSYANFQNSSELNWEPLSGKTVFGMPCFAKCSSNLLITAFDVVCDSTRSTFQ